MGVPVVAWDGGGVAEWHSGPEPVPWGDIEGLALALRRAVEDPAPAPVPPRVSRDARMERLLEIYREVRLRRGHLARPAGPTADRP